MGDGDEEIGKEGLSMEAVEGGSVVRLGMAVVCPLGSALGTKYSTFSSLAFFFIFFLFPFSFLFFFFFLSLFLGWVIYTNRVMFCHI